MDTIPTKELASGSVTITYVDGQQVSYDDVTNVSLSRDWAFIRFIDGGRIQIPVVTVRELCEDEAVFVKGVKND